MKILIADDEAIVRSSLDGILKKGGDFETDFALDGEEALNKIKSDLYDAVLLDLEMPKLDGYELLKQARKIYPNLPVIFITGKADVKKIAASIARNHLNGFIEKPFTPNEVLEALNKAIKKTKRI
ncbi:MAG: response regulator [Candidatus Margulisbacteria bacterium]|nr:response regulator [Candidatus Margulisiibacteriota bacterium]